MEYSPAINGISKRLAHAEIFQNRIAQIKRQIGKHRAGLLFDLKMAIAAKRANHVRAERATRRDVRAAFAQLQRSSGGVRHYRQADALNLRALAPLIIIA